MTRFYKLSGAGNDFIALCEPPADPSAEDIVSWCRRGDSIGADGLFVLQRDGDSSVRMRYYNRDGRPADLCLNGTRCAARLAFHLTWAQRTVTIRTATGPIEASSTSADLIRLAAPLPDAVPELIELDSGEETWRGMLLRVGVPHLVVPVPELEPLAVEIVGRALRRHSRLAPDGTNVMFIRYRDRRRLDIRSYERGVEAETAACGTGTLAAVAVGLWSHRLDLPVVVETRRGFELVVDGSWNGGRVESWTLAGDARLVARGEIMAGASHQSDRNGSECGGWDDC